MTENGESFARIGPGQSAAQEIRRDEDRSGAVLVKTASEG